jgi:hypothetical protein
MASYTNVSYHTLDDPLNPKILPNQYSDLHTLYPGKAMESSDNFDRYSISHDDVIAARKQFDQTRIDISQSQVNLEKKALAAGGGAKMTVNAVSDPSEMIEDPELKQASMMPIDQTANLSQTPVDFGGEEGGVPPSMTTQSGQPELRNRSGIDSGEDRTPLKENFKGDGNGTKSDSGSFYRWVKWAIIGMVIFMFVFLLVTGQLKFW